MMICWKMVNKLEINQYTVKPAGKVQNMKVKTKGIAMKIFFCNGSVVGVGDIFWMKNMEMPYRIGVTK